MHRLLDVCYTLSMTRVVGYIRVSTEAQADGGVSLEAQRAKLEAYCKALDLELVGIESDEGLSAKSLERPGLDRALAHLRSGRADALLVSKLDRLTRSVRDLGVLVDDYFGGGRWALLSVGDAIDTRSAAGRLVLNVLASVSQWEREAIGERTADALAHLRSCGVRLGGAALGWSRGERSDGDGRKVIVEVDEEVDTVVRIVALRRAGHSYRGVCEVLAVEGRRPKRGSKWFPNSVRRVYSRACEGSRSSANERSSA